VADAQLLATRSPEEGGAQLSFMNPGGLRADLVPDGQGLVRYGQLYAVQPFSYRYDLTQPAGARISQMVLNGAPLADAQPVRVVMSSFLDSGGDNFTVLTQGRDRQVGALDLDALEAYFRQQSPVAPPATDRITRVGR
jgi:5'-nucleotidase